jgi:biopolymer transport protein ExbD
MPLKTFQDDLPAMNMTPMIDVFLQLIIFFMVGTSLRRRNIG